MNPFPTVRLIQSAAESDAVLAAARANGDSIICPSHVLLRDGEIVGGASLGAVPLVLAWHHTEKISVRDSLHLKQLYDSMMDVKGARKFVIACNQRSPYHAHMLKLGYKSIWPTEVFEGGVG